MSNTIEIFMQVPDESAKMVRQPVKIKLSNAKETTEKVGYSSRYHSTWKVRFSTQLPKHVHGFLLGKKYSESSLGRGKSDFTDLKKTVSGNNLESVTKNLNWYFDVYVHLHSLHTAPRNKRIWIGFNLDPLKEVTSKWNRAMAGSRISTKLSFFVGYQTEGGRTIWDSNGLRLHQSYDKDIYESKSVEWTEEREDQIRAFADRLNDVNQTLSSFLLALNDDNFSGLLNGGLLQLPESK